MVVLTFNTEELASIALAKINENIGYPLPGINASSSKIDELAQGTTTWAIVQKANDLDLWYFPKPEDEFMEGVENFEVMEFNKAWLPPETL